MTVFVTSDTHFGHPLVAAVRGFITHSEIKSRYDAVVAEQGRVAAIQYVKSAVSSDPDLSMRSIADTDAHDAAVITSINKAVDAVRCGNKSENNDDSCSCVSGSNSESHYHAVQSGNTVDLWILGDIGYRTSMEYIHRCLRALHATHLHLVIGNHDINFRHRELDDEWQHIFTTIQDSACITISGVEYNLSHFPYREDLNPDTVKGKTPVDGSDNAYDSRFTADALSRDGRRLLFGHTHQHTKSGPQPDSLHVGLDSWDLRPVLETQITAWFDSLGTV